LIAENICLIDNKCQQQRPSMAADWRQASRLSRDARDLFCLELRLLFEVCVRAQARHDMSYATLEQFSHSATVEIDDHLVMLHALAALHRAKIPHDAIVTVAHASQSAISEHVRRMHLPQIQSNLDRERLKNTAQKYIVNDAGSVRPRR
jgi:hypothetical protein